MPPPTPTRPQMIPVVIAAMTRPAKLAGRPDFSSTFLNSIVNATLSVKIPNRVILMLSDVIGARNWADKYAAGNEEIEKMTAGFHATVLRSCTVCKPVLIPMVIKLISAA